MPTGNRDPKIIPRFRYSFALSGFLKRSTQPVRKRKGVTNSEAMNPHVGGHRAKERPKPQSSGIHKKKTQKNLACLSVHQIDDLTTPFVSCRVLEWLFRGARTLRHSMSGESIRGAFAVSMAHCIRPGRNSWTAMWR